MQPKFHMLPLHPCVFSRFKISCVILQEFTIAWHEMSSQNSRRNFNWFLYKVQFENKIKHILRNNHPIVKWRLYKPQNIGLNRNQYENHSEMSKNVYEKEEAEKKNWPRNGRKRETTVRDDRYLKRSEKIN